MIYADQGQHVHGIANRPPEIYQDRQFPTWHFSMMNDHDRNRAIYESIDSIDLTGKNVFEIGTGAGLVAMYFARCGAKHVYTCELDNQLFDLASRTIEKNGLSDKVTVINSKSTDFINSEKFDFTPDVIFTETLDCGVIGEGYRSVADDILAIANPDTIILPSEIRQFGFMVNSAELVDQNKVVESDIFDLSLVNDFSTRTYFPIRYQIYHSKTLSDSNMIRKYTYLDKHVNADVFSLTAYSSGVCHGIVSYFHAQFGKSVVSNDVRDNCHWHQAFHPFPEPIQVTPGETYQFMLHIDGSVSIL